MENLAKRLESYQEEEAAKKSILDWFHDVYFSAVKNEFCTKLMQINCLTLFEKSGSMGHIREYPYCYSNLDSQGVEKLSDIQNLYF